MSENTFSQAPRSGAAARIYRETRVVMAAPLLVLYILTSEKELILADSDRWMELLQQPQGSCLGNLLFLLGNYKEFRNVFYYRVWRGNLLAAAASLILQLFFKAEPTLHLRSPQIGPGFFAQHGYATSIGAYSIGKNCSVNQLVVIGWTDRTRGPILGDNVSVKAGAKVLGPITIGNNVTVGANAVVTKDVPANCVVAGVPARIIRRNGVRVDEPLPARTKADESFAASLRSLNEHIASDSTPLDFDVALSSGGRRDGIPPAERSGNTN
jgi:serine O-acetyltransferase